MFCWILKFWLYFSPNFFLIGGAATTEEVVDPYNEKSIKWNGVFQKSIKWKSTFQKTIICDVFQMNAFTWSIFETSICTWSIFHWRDHSYLRIPTLAVSIFTAVTLYEGGIRFWHGLGLRFRPICFCKGLGGRRKGMLEFETKSQCVIKSSQ